MPLMPAAILPGGEGSSGQRQSQVAQRCKNRVAHVGEREPRSSYYRNRTGRSPNEEKNDVPHRPDYRDRCSLRAPRLPDPNRRAIGQGHGMEMYYEVLGEGDPLIVLHGAYMNILDGCHYPKLAETHKVYAIEFQGHAAPRISTGRSPIPILPMTSQPSWMPLKIEKADVFGYSMGAAAGLQLPFAIRKSQQARPAPPWPMTRGLAAGVQGLHSQMSSRCSSTCRLPRTIASSLQSDGFPELVRKLIALEKEPMAWEADVRALKTPVLIITGDVDVATLEHSSLCSGCSVGASWATWANRCPPLALPSSRRRRTRRHQPARAASCVRRTFSEGQDAEGFFE